MSSGRKEFEKYMRQYETEHRQPTTRLTHMVGIPLITFSLIYVLFNWKIGITLFVLGWGIQFVGHWFFEHNNPAFFQGPVYLLTGVVWSFRAWAHLFRWTTSKTGR